MAVVELHGRDEIAAFFGCNPRAHAYELGDLDDFDWPHTRWYGWQDDSGALTQIVLLYSQPDVPVVIAIAEEPTATMEALVTSIVPLLPSPLYAHASPHLIPVLERRFSIAQAEPHVKLALNHPERLPSRAASVEILTAADVPEIESFYRLAYPGTWFSPRMLGTERYVGIRQAGLLACVAGVHVYSPTWRVAALGNVATLPEYRGRGLAQSACASLCLMLLDDGIETIALNVRSDNSAAIAAYAHLGFEHAASYVEASLVAHP